MELDALPEDFEGQPFYPIGPGLCRGEGWQFENWPQDGGVQTLEGNVTRHSTNVEILKILRLNFY